MKREIRFRLRIGNKVVGYEKWYKGVQITDTNPCGANPCWLYSKDGKYWNPDFIWHEDKDESTGLLDKHGKDIFQGDVVKELSGKCVVEYKDYVFLARNIKTGNPYYFIHPEQFEIIGNIYENPNLLTVAEE